MVYLVSISPLQKDKLTFLTCKKMINSMTGYGRSEFVINSELYFIEIKTLNSKHIDVNLKTPSIYRQRESEIRQIIAKNLKRGKIDVFISKKKTKYFKL